MKGMRVLVAVGLVTLTIGGPTAWLEATEAPPPGAPPTMPPPASWVLAAQPGNLADSRLSPLLNQLWASRFAPGFRGDARSLAELVVERDSVQVVVEARAEMREVVTRTVAILSGRVTAIAGDMVFATVPIAQLPTLASSDAVVRVRTPYRSTPMVLSEGVALHGAPAMFAHGVTGQGVKVGVLDCGGFSGYQALLGTDLPPSITLWNGAADPVGSNVHGAGCAEIIHDMAPDAALYFAHDGDEAEYYAAVDWLVAQGVDVISYSCGWTGSFPADGSGMPYNTVNAKVEEARAAGVLFVTSSGNGAEGDSYVAAYQQVSGTPWHNFDGDWSNGVFSWSGSAYEITLTWDDWPADPATSGSTQDYSLELWYWDGGAWQIVATSDNPQHGNPGELPFEEIYFNPPVDEWHYLTISRVDATEDNVLNLKKSSYGSFLHYQAASSLSIPADCPAATTVGAVHWSSVALEPFSSQGPTLGPGGVLAGGWLKPDLVAADAVSTSSYGASNGVGWPNGSGFFGTSAAAPHVAGGAALLLAANPDLTADAVEAALLMTADDLGIPGPDNATGYGLMTLTDPVVFADGFEGGDTGAWGP